MDLSERLRRLRAESRTNQRSLAPQPDDQAIGRLEALVGGTWYRAGDDRCYVTERRYGLDHAYGQAILGDAHALDKSLWMPWLGDDADPGFDLCQALFIDTETTGLGTGPTTYAFMVGVGFYDEDDFCVRQYFMPDYADEPALLDRLIDDLAAHPGLVSFNGRSFDWPLLRTRLIMAGRLPEQRSGSHLDLLHMARRFWRNRLPSCSLSSLEQHVLQIDRTSQDVPGYLIPAIYEDFRRRGIVEPLAGVFYHNQLDIVSLAALAIHMARILADPSKMAEPLTDHYALGRLYEQASQIPQAISAYQRAWDDEGHLRALQALSTLLKRQGNLDRAVDLWQQAMGGAPVYACVELAKYYEHRLLDYQQARTVTLVALEELGAGASRGFQDRAQRQALRHRLARLERKLACRTRTARPPDQETEDGIERR